MIDLIKASHTQARLARRIRLEWDQRNIETVAGIDCAYHLPTHKIGAVVVVCRVPSFQVLETAIEVRSMEIPYVPGFLNFREAPASMKAFRKLSLRPDVTLIDGNGIAHPRKMGLASYVGILLDISTIGCAKNPFFPCTLPGVKAGSYTYFRNQDKETAGFCLRTRENTNPVFVSPGHRIDLSQSKKLVLACSKFRIPEPLRLAHLKASRIFKIPHNQPEAS